MYDSFSRKIAFKIFRYQHGHKFAICAPVFFVCFYVLFFGLMWI